MGKSAWKWASGALLVLGSAAAGAQAVYVSPPVAVVPVQPARTWVPGHWAWHGHQRVWVQGHWIVSAPRHDRGGPRRWDRAARWDQDRDGIPNRRDRDIDGDGVRNHRDRAPTDPRWR